MINLLPVTLNSTVRKFHSIYTLQIYLNIVCKLVEFLYFRVLYELLGVGFSSYFLNRYHILQVYNCLISIQLFLNCLNINFLQILHFLNILLDQKAKDAQLKSEYPQIYHFQCSSMPRLKKIKEKFCTSNFIRLVLNEI